MTNGEAARIWIACNVTGLCARDTLWFLAINAFGEEAMITKRYFRLLPHCHSTTLLKYMFMLLPTSLFVVADQCRYRSGDPRYNLKRKVINLLKKIPIMGKEWLNVRLLSKKKRLCKLLTGKNHCKRRAVGPTAQESSANIPSSIPDVLDSQSSLSSLRGFDPDALYLGYISPSRRFSQSFPPDPPPPETAVLNPNPSPPPDCPYSPRPQSPLFPSSPAPTIIPPTPSEPATHSHSHSQVSYDPSYTPIERDYACDFEAVMSCVGDVNRMSRFLKRGVTSHIDSTGIPTTREDVIEVLVELRQMLNRMFDRFPERFRQ